MSRNVTPPQLLRYDCLSQTKKLTEESGITVDCLVPQSDTVRGSLQRRNLLYGKKSIQICRTIILPLGLSDFLKIHLKVKCKRTFSAVTSLASSAIICQFCKRRHICMASLVFPTQLAMCHMHTDHTYVELDWRTGKKSCSHFCIKTNTYENLESSFFTNPSDIFP